MPNTLSGRYNTALEHYGHTTVDVNTYEAPTVVSLGRLSTVPVPQGTYPVSRIKQSGHSTIYQSELNGEPIIIKECINMHNAYQEYQFLKNLQSSKNIVKVIKYQETHNKAEIWMNACQCDLRELVNDKGSMKDKELAYSVIQLCNALHYVHCMGLVHLDIKIENILLGSANQLQLCDFGCTKIVGSVLNNKTGTPSSSSMFLDNVSTLNPIKAEPFLDINSLGVVLFQMRFSANPFTQASMSLHDFNMFFYNPTSVLDILKLQYSEQDMPFINLIHQMITTKMTMDQVFQSIYFQSILNTQVWDRENAFLLYMSKSRHQTNLSRQSTNSPTYNEIDQFGVASSSYNQYLVNSLQEININTQMPLSIPLYISRNMSIS